MKTKTEQELQEAMVWTGLLTPVKMERKGGNLASLWRQVPGREKDWLEVVLVCLRLGFEDSLVIARRYLLKDNQMVFGWHFQLMFKNAAELDDAIKKVISILKGRTANMEPVPVPKTQLSPVRIKKGPSIKTVVSSPDRIEEEMPLAHVNGELNVPTKPVWSQKHGKMIGGQKGATYVGNR